MGWRQWMLQQTNEIMARWLEINAIDMFSIHSKEISVVAKGFIRISGFTLKNKIINAWL